MSRPIQPIPDVMTRRKFREVDGRLLSLSAKLDRIKLREIQQVGGVRIGPLSARGSATDRYPELFIEWEATYARAYITMPTSASGDFEWMPVIDYPF